MRAILGCNTTFLSEYLLIPEKCCTFAALNQNLRRYEEADT